MHNKTEDLYEPAPMEPLTYQGTSPLADIIPTQSPSRKAHCLHKPHSARQHTQHTRSSRMTGNSPQAEMLIDTRPVWQTSFSARVTPGRTASWQILCGKTAYQHRSILAELLTGTPPIWQNGLSAHVPLAKLLTNTELLHRLLLAKQAHLQRSPSHRLQQHTAQMQWWQEISAPHILHAPRLEHPTKLPAPKVSMPILQKLCPPSTLIGCIHTSWDPHRHPTLRYLVLPLWCVRAYARARVRVCVHVCLGA